MAQIFNPSTNTLSKASIFGAAFLVAGGLWLAASLSRSPWATSQHVIREQPVPFSHAHHVGGLGIDCRYCHTTVEVSAFAGMPPTQTCMNCHSQIWARSPMLEPVRASLKSGEPIRWTRVHDLPDFVYFDHSIHVAKGVGCATCHGQVDRMPLMWQHSTLQMEWCLECHRDPTPHLRPHDAVFSMDWRPPDDLAGRIALRLRLSKEYDVAPRDDCSTCHR